MTRQPSAFRPNTGAPATLQMLAGASRQGTPARVVSLAQTVLVLATEAVIPAGTALRVDIESALLLGEAMHTGETNGTRTVAVRVEQIIPSVPEIARLMQAVMGERVKAAAEVAAETAA